MPTDNKAISVTYSDEKLRILVEEFITMQKHDFTFKGVCSFIIYRTMEDMKTTNTGLYESNQLIPADCNRIICVLKKIVNEGRIKITPDQKQYDFYDDSIQFLKIED